MQLCTRTSSAHGQSPHACSQLQPPCACSQPPRLRVHTFPALGRPGAACAHLSHAPMCASHALVLVLPVRSPLATPRVCLSRPGIGAACAQPPGVRACTPFNCAQLQ